MAFKPLTVRLPEEYIRFIEQQAGSHDESHGYIIQQALYHLSSSGMMGVPLPMPKRRDKRKEDKK